MSRFKNIFILLLCSVTSFCFAQKEDRNWVFGDSVGVNFNNLTNPTIFFTHSTNDEACATISDKNGNKLFYTSFLNPNGIEFYDKIFNRYDEVVENGDSIFLYFSSTNGAMFLPFPEDTNKYYFFSLGANTFIDSNQVLYYSILDKAANSNHAKVISKNIPLTDSLTEKVCAIKHANGRDWWLICHKMYSSIYVKYLIDPTGIHGPFFQNIGSIFYLLPASEISSTKDGSKIVLVGTLGNIDVSNFNRCTGELSNSIELGQPPFDGTNSSVWTFYGAEFSPDGSRLYVGKFYENNAFFSTITQYTLNGNNPTSTKIVDSLEGQLFDQFQLGPDDKIYITRPYTFTYCDTCYKYLAAIENPNDSGVACNLNLFALYLGGGISSLGLPNMPNYNLGVLIGSECDTIPNSVNEKITKEKSIVRIYPNPATNELKIEILNGIAPKQIEITNSLGVQSLKFNVQRPTTQVNIKSLAPDVYFVKLKMQDGSVTVRRFVKL